MDQQNGDFLANQIVTLLPWAGFAAIGYAVNYWHKMRKIQTLKKTQPNGESQRYLTLEDFPGIIKNYLQYFEQSKIMERIIPRKFEKEEDLFAVVPNITYSRGETDISAISNVSSLRLYSNLMA
jgi:hypothetical protein